MNNSSGTSMIAWLKKYGFLLLIIIGVGYWFLKYKVVHEVVWSEHQFEISEGVPVSAAEALQSPCIVHFYATWCGPCLAELPELAKYQKENPKVRIYLVTDDSWDKIERVKSTYEFLILRVDDMDGLNVHTIPTTYFLNASGKYEEALQGACDWSDPAFRKRINPIVQTN
jgi:thiol-disulfide isomerase/thioredoxin